MRNIDEIKRLKRELGRYQKKVADDAKAMKELREQLEAFQRGSQQIHEAVDAILIRLAMEHGELVTDDETGEALGWRLELAQKPDAALCGKYEVRTRVNEAGGYTVAVMDREAE